MRAATQLLLDRFAIGASVVCAFHCAVLPVLLVAFPSLVVLPVDDHVFHEMMVWLVLPSSLIAVLLGCRRHKDHFVLLGVTVGLIILVLTGIYGHDTLGESGEKIATLFAATILAISHWRNFSLCRKDSCKHCA